MTVTHMSQFFKWASDSNALSVLYSCSNTVWVTRNDPESRPFFLVGQYSASAVSLTIEGGTKENPVCTLVSNPSFTAFRVNDYGWNGNPSEGDTIRIPNEKAAPHVLRWNGSEWGRIVKVPGERYGVWQNNDTVPAGTGWCRCTGSVPSRTV